MSPLLEQAFNKIEQLSDGEQQQIAAIILRILQQTETDTAQKKLYFLEPAPQASGYTDTAENHDAVIAESILNQQ